MNQNEILLELIISYLYDKNYKSLQDIQNYILYSDIGKDIFKNYPKPESRISKINKTIFEYSLDRDISTHSGINYFESRFEKSTKNQEFRLIKKHRKQKHNYFIVFQGKTYKEEFE